MEAERFEMEDALNSVYCALPVAGISQDASKFFKTSLILFIESVFDRTVDIYDCHNLCMISKGDT